jgi:hypothetical protein
MASQKVHLLHSASLQPLRGGLMKISIYFSEKLILFLFRLHNEGQKWDQFKTSFLMIFITHPHPQNPTPKGRGDFHSLNSFPQGGREFGHFLPLPLREGVGGWGVADENFHIF